MTRQVDARPRCTASMHGSAIHASSALVTASAVDSPRQPATVTAIASPTPDVRVLHLRLADGVLGFEAGQYVRLWFGSMPPRDYSLGNRPGERDLEFHIRITGESVVGQYIGSQLKVGDPVGLAGPFGEACLRSDHHGPVLAVAGGTGIVPIQSIVTTALAQGMEQPLHLYWGARTAADLYAVPRFRALAERHRSLRVVGVVAEGDPEGYRTGNVSDVVDAAFRDLRGFKAYVAGPPAMVGATKRALLARGLTDADIHTDPFLPGDHHSPNVVAAQ